MKVLCRLLFLPAIVGAFVLFLIDWIARGSSARDWPQAVIDWARGL